MEPSKSTFQKLNFHFNKHKSLVVSTKNQMDFQIFELTS
jgi:hypothetical protein